MMALGFIIVIALFAGFSTYISLKSEKFEKEGLMQIA